MTFLKTLCVLIFALACAGKVAAQTCTVSTLPLVFGAYDPLSNSPATTSGQVSITCQAVISLLVAYSVKLSAGGGTSFATRRMINGSSTLNYQLYMDPAWGTAWGDGSAGTQFNIGGYLLSVLVPVTQNFPVYGKIAALQNVNAGTFLDSVTVLVSY